jgi:hypothetical protein
MSIMICDWCGTAASDNDVTWECWFDASIGEVITKCEECDA